MYKNNIFLYPCPVSGRKNQMMGTNWRSIPCKIAELRLDIVLACGQSFRWKEIKPGLWRSVLAKKVWTLKQNDNELFYQIHCGHELETPTDDKHEVKTFSKPKKAQKQGNSDNHGTRVKKEVLPPGDLYFSNAESTLFDYFQLQTSLGELYKKWSSADANFRQVAADFTGIRMLRQDPTENLFAFICSSNNNISRISGMVERMCEKYGDKLCELDGQTYYTFPDIAKLASENVEQELRSLGFGYRAKYINQTAKYIMQNHNDNWLQSLRSVSYEDAHSELLKLPGVGSKVADCVCLMSLDKHSAIPVDTHVWQIASRDYMPKLTKTKSLTDKVYKEIGDFFRNLYGDYAGWAHSVLFSADLKKFQDLKTKKIRQDTQPIRKKRLNESTAKTKKKRKQEK
ncbi:N-glycosylase/DNA lyase-like [Ptychodera flava]|uniref:N-glycosylase/DNA lyase-like n=1 Tax=Ptychodera flava TaxID=63121 RepID=UPI00396A4AED